jgi:hypothetical protein
MKIVQDNYKNGGGYFSTTKETVCPRCTSKFFIESANDILRKVYNDEFMYFVPCPCCKHQDIELKNVPSQISDLIDDRYKD